MVRISLECTYIYCQVQNFNGMNLQSQFMVLNNLFKGFINPPLNILEREYPTAYTLLRTSA